MSWFVSISFFGPFFGLFWILLVYFNGCFCPLPIKKMETKEMDALGKKVVGRIEEMGLGVYGRGEEVKKTLEEGSSWK